MPGGEREGGLCERPREASLPGREVEHAVGRGDVCLLHDQEPRFSAGWSDFLLRVQPADDAPAPCGYGLRPALSGTISLGEGENLLISV